MNPGSSLAAIRERKPLVHQITNYVVMNETANATLALGALPVMAHAPEEVEEMVGLASALVLNIGTLSEHWIEAMLIAGRAASARGIPVERHAVAATHGAGCTHSATLAALLARGEPLVAAARGAAAAASRAVAQGLVEIGEGEGPVDVLGVNR